MEALRAGDPERVGEVVLRGRLGAGGMGEVFLGRSPGGRAVAVKVVHPHLARQREFRRRFAREVAAARAVSGAFTAPVVAAGPEDDPPWIATVYVPGPDLAEAVERVGPLPEGSVWLLAAGLTEALQAIHGERLLHRDLKPSNVLVAADGPRVIDFGIARASEGTVLTGTGQVMGTPGFMSPEQAEGGNVGPASDVFALGAVIAYAAGATAPFGQGAPLEVLHRVVNGQPRLDALQGPLHELALACLAKNPAERPTLPQLLDRITSHWDPPDESPGMSPWPAAVTALIHHRTTHSTAPYTRPGGPVPTHSAPTVAAPRVRGRERPDPGPRSDGPRDSSEVRDPGEGRVDLGGLFVPHVAGMELRADVSDGEIVAATVILRDSAIQLQAFAAPEQQNIWDEVREEIGSGFTRRGVAVDEVEGPLGRELRAQVPGRLPDGTDGFQVVRFVGVDGPRWFLRGVISGQGAVQPMATGLLEQVFRDTVVVRGDVPMAHRAPIVLTPPAAPTATGRRRPPRSPWGFDRAAEPGH